MSFKKALITAWSILKILIIFFMLLFLGKYHKEYFVSFHEVTARSMDLKEFLKFIEIFIGFELIVFLLFFLGEPPNWYLYSERFKNFYNKQKLLTIFNTKRFEQHYKKFIKRAYWKLLSLVVLGIFLSLLFYHLSSYDKSLYVPVLTEMARDLSFIFIVTQGMCIADVLVDFSLLAIQKKKHKKKEERKQQRLNARKNKEERKQNRDAH